MAPALTAAVFPGQGSQVVGMARAFYEASPAARGILDEAEHALPGLHEIMWQGPEEALKLTANQQPALVAAGAAAFAAYGEAGGNPVPYALGHSLGEFTALVVADSLDVAQAVRLVHKRGSYMQEAVREGEGAMAAVLKLEATRINQVCRETEGIVEIANLNAPRQTVIAGEARAVRAAAERLKDEGARVVFLNVSAPFHCSLMQSAAKRLAADLAGTSFRDLKLEVVSTVTAEVIEHPAMLPALLSEQVVKPVRWAESVTKLYTFGVRRFIEFGSGKVLTNLLSRIVPDAEALAVYDPETLREALP